MILPDVNVLVYAFRKDVPEHSACRAWLNSIILDSSPFGVSPLALSAVVRIATSPRIYRIPSSFEDTFGFCEDITSQSHCRLITPGERHWEIFRRLCVETDTRGPRVSDAWYAALAIEAGVTFVTMDRDFARFPGLRWQRPD